MILSIVSAILVLDQLTKFLANRYLSVHQSLPVIKGFFHITLVRNRGAAFGLFQGQAVLFIVTALFAICLVYYSLRKNAGKFSLAYRISLGLILAGALGNLIDRVVLGYVVDFLDLRVWPVFNVADSAITIGAVLMGISLLQQQRSHSEVKSQK